MYQHLLISTDGSEVAQKGIDQGLALARSFSAKTTILMVAETLYPSVAGYGGMSGSTYVEYAALLRSEAEKILAAAKEAADSMGVTADTVCLENVWPAEAIVETAQAHSCDLIVMASHGRRGVRRLILGSVTLEVLARSSVPVLVVR